MTLFELDKKSKKIEELSAITNSPDFWSTQQDAVKIVNELNELKDKVDEFNKLSSNLQELQGFLKNIDPSEIEMIELLDEELAQFEKELEEFRRSILFSGEYDSLNCTLEIHPGAGGTESHDWASMLLRMYSRFCERHRFSCKVLDYIPGEEAGISSVTLLISGRNAYGMLKSEKGVHRLVRISPFDTNSRRHTSFASVNVVPEFNNNNEIVIDDKDLRIDTYRSGGAGGQNVNKVSSAVRITHIPTGIVVSCQIERSQLNNKATCMEMLKNKLLERKLAAEEAKLKGIVGVQKDIEWGSQIRSYVFCPYTLVKDARTGCETNDLQSVMDGDLDDFIYAFLEKEVKEIENSK